MPNSRPPQKRSRKTARPNTPASSQPDTPVLVAFGAALREARIARGLSQEDLARLANVDPSYIGRIERGGHNLPLLTVLRLTDALRLPIAELMAKAKL